MLVYGVEVIEVTRKASGSDEDNLPDYISASKVRKAIKNDQLESIIDFLPESTRDFLFSEASLDIRLKIKLEGKGAHGKDLSAGLDNLGIV